MSPQQVKEELERILSSKTFADTERHPRFLSFAVARTLDGREIGRTVWVVSAGMPSTPGACDVD
jgi:hypothetical protein